MNEIWIKVQENDRYSVSNLGRVRNDDTGYVLKNSSDQPYVYVTLHFHDGRQITRSIHSLVAQGFIDPVEGLDQVNHIDGNKQHNVSSNLEWSDRSEQMNHAYELGLKEKPTGLGRIPVRIRETGEVFPSILACAKYINGHSSGISNCLLGKSHSYLGFTFEKG